MDGTRRQMFLRYVDVLTVLRLKLHRFLQDTEKAFLDAGKAPPPIAYARSLSQVLKGLYPELMGQESLLNAIHHELLIRGLVGSGSRTTVMTPSGARGRFTSDLGDQLLAFIAAPAAGAD